MEAYDVRFVYCLRCGCVATLLALALAMVPGVWRDLGSASCMIRGGFPRGVAVALLLLIAPALAVARKRDPA